MILIKEVNAMNENNYNNQDRNQSDEYYHNEDMNTTGTGETGTWNDPDESGSENISYSAADTAQETTQTQPDIPEEPEYGGAAVFSGSGEAEVDYNVARGSSMTFGTDNSYEDLYESGSYDEYEPDHYGEPGGYNDGYGSDPSGYAASSAERSSTGSYSTGRTSNPSCGNQQQYDSFHANPPNRTAAGHKKSKKKSSGAFSRFLASLLVIVLCGLAGFGGATIANRNSRSGYSQTPTNVNITGDVTSANAASVIAEKVMPSVVGISTISQAQRQTIFGLQSGTVQGIGTGIIVSEDGYILTNSHVISDGEAQQITVDLYDGTEYSGNVLWNDSSLDLAIVKIDASGLAAAEIGDSDNVNIGDYALAIGNPLGLNYERSVTSGIISGLNRSITTQDESTGKTNKMDGLIQTDAAINSGNSGGPLINSSGQVIGINTAKASSSEGLGFAIPINTATPIIKQIKEKGSYQQTYIGISGIDLSTIAENYATDFKAKDGVYIMQIYTESPAAAAGLKEGDIITEIDGKSIDGMSALKSSLINYVPGDTIELTVERDKITEKYSLTLGSSEDATTTLQSNENSSSNGSGSYGGSGGFGGLFGQ